MIISKNGNKEIIDLNKMLNSNNVNTVTIDKKNKVWIGSDKGLIYFSSSKLLGTQYLKYIRERHAFRKNLEIALYFLSNSDFSGIGKEKG